MTISELFTKIGNTNVSTVGKIAEDTVEQFLIVSLIVGILLLGITIYMAYATGKNSKKDYPDE